MNIYHVLHVYGHVYNISSYMTCCMSSAEPLTVSPQVSSKFVCRLVEQSGDALVQRIHVFHQPLVCFVVHLHHSTAKLIVATYDVAISIKQL